MKTKIIFRSFEGFDHIKKFITDEVENALGCFESLNGYACQVTLNTIGARSWKHSPSFECELFLTGGGLQHPLFAKKHNLNFYSCVRSAIRSAEKMLRRRSKIRVMSRRRSSSKLKRFQLVASKV